MEIIVESPVTTPSKQMSSEQVPENDDKLASDGMPGNIDPGINDGVVGSEDDNRLTVEYDSDNAVPMEWLMSSSCCFEMEFGENVSLCSSTVFDDRLFLRYPSNIGALVYDGYSKRSRERPRTVQIQDLPEVGSQLAVSISSPVLATRQQRAGQFLFPSILRRRAYVRDIPPGPPRGARRFMISDPCRRECPWVRSSYLHSDSSVRAYDHKLGVLRNLLWDEDRQRALLRYSATTWCRKLNSQATRVVLIEDVCPFL